jgi:Asp-tRNA(Asn)/Glu-tRNA(Gln) amidotransferase A subunit family amidase
MDERSAAQLSATEAAQRIREGVLTSEELVGACLERIRQVEPTVQAWTFLDEDLALAQARAADEHKRSGQAFGELHGVPVGLKDIIDTGDMPTENGCALHKGRAPRNDAAVVAMLRAAGAVVLGKTVTTECAYFSPGKTRNPHNPEHTPGGSSSGSAAAVAASMVPLALGSQTAGSTIRPGAFCGVYAFKPTHGLVPRTGILQLSRTLDHVGLFARTLEDVALLAEAVAGYHEGDADSRPRARIAFRAGLAEEPPVTPMLAFVKTPHWDKADAEAKEAVAELVETLGDRVEEVDPFLVAGDEPWAWHKTILEAEMAANFEPEWTSGRDKLSEKLRSQIERGREVRAVDYQRALKRAAVQVEGFDELFTERYDAILTLAAPGTAPKGMATGDPVFNAVWTLFGMPALSLPLMQGENGLPLGVQLVGRRNFDARLLRTARWLVSRISA